VADELRKAVSKVEEKAQMTRKAVITTLDDMRKLKYLIGRAEALIGSKQTLTQISSHMNCPDILNFCRGHWKVMTSPGYCLGRVRDVIFRKPPRFPVIPTNPSTWNGWFSDPKFIDNSIVTIKFQEGICVVIDRYSLGSGVLGLKRSGYLRSWKLQGCVCGKWETLDKEKMTNILSDGEPHEFHITTHRCAVEAIRLCQTGRNRLRSCQMHLTTFILSGGVIGPPGMFGMDDSTETEVIAEEEMIS
jgi:hypothetical protein